MAFGTLLLLHPDGSRITVSLEKTTVRVGRADDNDVVLAHPQVADHHAQILCDADGIQVLDLGSPAGTAIDDQRLDHYGLAPLGFGQRLQIGPVWLLLYREAEAPPAPVAPPSRWSWPPRWWVGWREQARARQAAPESASTSAQLEAPEAAPVASAPASRASAPAPALVHPAASEVSAPPPSLLERARSWQVPEWVKRIFIWTWLKQNGQRALAWLLGLVGFFWLRTFLSRWLGISPDSLNPLNLLDARKEPASQRGPDATPDQALVSSTPVWREPQQAAPPTLPTIPVRRSELLHLTADPTDLATDPGRAVVLSVTVVNRSPLVDRVSFIVDGLPEGWVSITPAALSLMPGDSGSSEIVVRPSRNASSVAGTHPFVVAARSGEGAEVRAAVAASLAITPFHDFRLDFQPQQRTVWRRARYELRIINNSNQTQAFDLQGRDEAQALLFGFQPAQPLVAPGQAALVEVMVRRRRLHLIGRPLTSAFHLLVEPTHRAVPAQQAQGRLIKRAISWSLLVLLLLLPVLAYALMFAPYAFRVAVAVSTGNRVPTPEPVLSLATIVAALPAAPSPAPTALLSPQPGAAPTPITTIVAVPAAAATSAAAYSPGPVATAEPLAGPADQTAAPAGPLAGPADQTAASVGLRAEPLVAPAGGANTGLDLRGPWAALPTLVTGTGGVTPPPASGTATLGQSTLLIEDLIEGQASNPGHTVADLLEALGYRAPSEGPGGMAVVGVEGGRWQYTTTGDLWRDFPPQTSPVSATLLVANDINRVRFVPDPDFNTETLEDGKLPRLQVRAWDGRLFRNGDTGIDTRAGSAAGAFGLTLGSVRQRVAPVNDQPTFKLQVRSLVLTGTLPLVIADAVTDVRRGPANEGHQGLSYDITVDPLCLTAVISDSGSLTLAPRANVQCSERVGTVVLRDSGGTASRGADRSEAQTFVYAVDTRNQSNLQASLDPLQEDPLRNIGLPVSEAVLRLGFYDQHGDASGLAVIGADNTYGQWQYRTGEGDWQNLTLASRAVPLLLRASAGNQVRFVPSPDYVGDATLTVLPWDGRPWDAAGALGASPAQLHQSVQAVNDPPTFRLSRNEIRVNDTDLATEPLFASVIRPGPENEAGQQIVFDVVPSGDVTVFAKAPIISPDGTLSYRAQPNRKADLSASVTLRDSEGAISAPVLLTIRVDTLSPAMTAFAVATGTAVVQTAPAQTTIAQTSTAAAAQTAIAQTAIAQTAVAQQTANAMAQQTRVAQQTATAQTLTAVASQTAVAAGATSTASALAQPSRLDISTIIPGSPVRANDPFDVDVVVLDRNNQVAVTNGSNFLITIELQDLQGNTITVFPNKLPTDKGRAKVTGLQWQVAGNYRLVVKSGALTPSAGAALTIKARPATAFAFRCFLANPDTACPASPPLAFTTPADQMFGFVGIAVDEFGNWDQTFSGSTYIKIGYDDKRPAEVLSNQLPPFSGGMLIFNSMNLPDNIIGEHFFFEFGTTNIATRGYTSEFTVIPGTPKLMSVVAPVPAWLNPSSPAVFKVIVKDVKQNPVGPNIRVCFQTNSPRNNNFPDLGFIDQNAQTTFGRVGIWVNTDSSGYGNSFRANSNGRLGAYLLYAYVDPRGLCDLNLDVSVPPPSPMIYVDFFLTNVPLPTPIP